MFPVRREVAPGPSYVYRAVQLNGEVPLPGVPCRGEFSTALPPPLRQSLPLSSLWHFPHHQVKRARQNRQDGDRYSEPVRTDYGRQTVSLPLLPHPVLRSPQVHSGHRISRAAEARAGSSSRECYGRDEYGHAGCVNNPPSTAADRFSARDVPLFARRAVLWGRLVNLRPIVNRPAGITHNLARTVPQFTSGQ